MREACTGYRHGSPELAQQGEPRPEYTPGTSKLQRYRAKATELGVGVRTVRRWAADLDRYGPAAVLRELGAPPGPGAATGALASRGGPPRQLSPVTAFGVTIADIMLHGRGDDPDPAIAAWLAANGASRRNTSGPADILASWDRASPALRAALARPLASQLDT